MTSFIDTIKNNLFLKILDVANIGWAVSTVVVFNEGWRFGDSFGLHALQIMCALPFLIIHILISLLRTKRLDLIDKWFLWLSFALLIVTGVLLFLILQK